VPERLKRTLRPARARRAALIAGSVALGAVLGGMAGWHLHDWWRPAAAPVAEAGAAMVRRAAMAHATYSPEVRYPVEVRADQEQHLVAWLSKRVGVKLNAPKLQDVGMSLVGGRLLPGETGPVALFMYETPAGQRVTLYVRTAATNSRETAFRYAREGNVRVFYWVDSKLGYALSSADISKEDLLKVANAAYQQLNPP
ncbi:MAG: anti-sigma factor family protein, partial [Burkholderiales bacterium]